MGLSDQKQESKGKTATTSTAQYGWKAPPTTASLDKLRTQQFEIDPGIAAQYGQARHELEHSFNQPAGAYLPKQVQQQQLQSGKERLGRDEAQAMRQGQYDVNKLNYSRDLAVAGMDAPTLTQDRSDSSGTSSGTVVQSESPFRVGAQIAGQVAPFAASL